MALYARSKNLARLIDRISTTEENNFQYTDTNVSAKIPLVFGNIIFKPTLIDGGKSRIIRSPNFPTNRDQKAPLFCSHYGIYLLSFNRAKNQIPNADDSDIFYQVYQEGILGGMAPSGRTDRNWYNFQKGTTYAGFGGLGTDGRRLAIVQYVKAGTFFTSALDDLRADYPNFFTSGIDQLFNEIVDFDCLIMFFNENATEYGSFRELPQLAVGYKREAKQFDPTGVSGFYGVGRNVGRCIWELITDQTYGLGIDQNTLNESDFTTTSIEVNTVLDMTVPIIDHINSMADLDFGYVTRTDGTVRYLSGTTNVVDFLIDDSVILGNVEIIYPDSNQTPTKIIASYDSRLGEQKSVEIGTSNANIVKINVNHLGTLEEVEKYVQFLFSKLRDCKEYKFTLDKTAQKLSVGDIVRLNCTVPELVNEDVRITDISLRDDYSFDISGESVITASGNVILTGARRILPTEDGEVYRMPRDDQGDPEPPQPVPNPPTPGEIERPEEVKLIIDLQHPFNLATGVENTDWYLGATLDNETPSRDWDVNGIQTRVGKMIERDFSTKMQYENIPSLIFANQGKKPPDYILYAVDVFRSDPTERKEKYVGIESSGNKVGRIYWPGFFRDLPQQAQRYYGVDWTSRGMVVWTRYIDPVMTAGANGYSQTTYQLNRNGQGDEFIRTIEPTQTQVNSVRPLFGSKYGNTNLANRVDGVYRIHFTGVYNETNNIGIAVKRAEYIGSTTFYGDGRGVLPQFEATSRQIFLEAGGSAWLYSYTTPPARNKRV